MFNHLLPSYFEWWHIPLLFLSSLIGESFGALVGGGSILTMPALLLTGLPLQSAIAIDNAAAIGTEAGIFAETKRQVLANKKLVIIMAIPLFLGGIVGTWLLLTVSSVVIKYFMAATVIALVINSYRGKQSVPTKVTKTKYVMLIAFLFVIGLYSNFIAAGEGAFSRMGIMSILGLTFIQTTGIKATATIPSRLYSLIVTAFAGLIVWPYLLTMWVSGFIAGKYAVKFAKHIPDKYMKLFLTIVSSLFVVYLLFFY